MKIENMPIDFFIRFLLSYTDFFFFNNRTVKLDFTLAFYMDVGGLEIPTYIHTSLCEWVSNSVFWIQATEEASKQAYYINAPEINLLSASYLFFINMKVLCIHREQQCCKTFYVPVIFRIYFCDAKHLGTMSVLRSFVLLFSIVVTHMCVR